MRIIAGLSVTENNEIRFLTSMFTNNNNNNNNNNKEMKIKIFQAHYLI